MATNSVNNPNNMDTTIYPAGTTKPQKLGQDDFMRLMIAQVQNQDPLEPKTNGDFIAQMAQFSTSDGVTNMKNSIDAMSSALQSNQALQASALVGRKVLVDSDQFYLESEGGASPAINLPEGVSNLTASIFSDTGELIRTIKLGEPNPGFHQFTWDGMNQKNERMPEGKYKLTVTGVYQGQEVALKTMAPANIDSVSLGGMGEGVILNTKGLGAVYLADVRQIFS